jgi:hypothetical protein
MALGYIDIRPVQIDGLTTRRPPAERVMKFCLWHPRNAFRGLPALPRIVG